MKNLQKSIRIFLALVVLGGILEGCSAAKTPCPCDAKKPKVRRR